MDIEKKWNYSKLKIENFDCFKRVGQHSQRNYLSDFYGANATVYSAKYFRRTLEGKYAVRIILTLDKTIRTKKLKRKFKNETDLLGIFQPVYMIFQPSNQEQLDTMPHVY